MEEEEEVAEVEEEAEEEEVEGGPGRRQRARCFALLSHLPSRSTTAHTPLPRARLVPHTLVGPQPTKQPNNPSPISQPSSPHTPTPSSSLLYQDELRLPRRQGILLASPLPFVRGGSHRWCPSSSLSMHGTCLPTTLDRRLKRHRAATAANADRISAAAPSILPRFTDT